MLRSHLYALAQRPYLLLTLAAFFWALNWVFSRAIRADFGPLTLSALRWAVALAILWPLAGRDMLREAAQIRAHWKLFAWLAFTGTGAYNALSLKGIQTTTALNGTLLNTLIPIVTLVLSFVFLSERPTPRRLSGVALGLAGALWMTVGGDWSRLLGLQITVGDAWVAAGMTSWAIYTMLLKKRSDTLSQLTLLTTLATAGFIVLLPLAVVEAMVVAPPQFAWRNLWVIAYMGVFPSIVCYLSWNRGIELVGAQRGSLFVYLIPLFAAGLSGALLGEHLQGFHLVGAALIVPGLMLATWQPKLIKA